MCQKCNWNSTTKIQRRLGHAIKNNTYKGRPIIDMDTPIDGGVYIGTGTREAIVVDSSKDIDIQNLYRNAKRKSRNIFGLFRKKFALWGVFTAVAEAMPIQDSDALDEILTKYNLTHDRKVDLGVFLHEGVGVCRHDALACGVILELMKRDGYIDGTASVDRNQFYGGRHAWTRYTDRKGVHILDVSLGYLGSLKDSGATWHYARPEDLQIK